MTSLLIYLHRRRLRLGISRHSIAIVLTMSLLCLFAFLLLSFGSARTEDSDDDSPFWYYYCDGGYCKKAELTPNVTNPISLTTCQLFCGDGGALWPKPTGEFTLGNALAHLDIDRIRLEGVDSRSRVGGLLQKNIDRLKISARRLSVGRVRRGGAALAIHLVDLQDSDHLKLTVDTKENYIIRTIEGDPETLRIEIKASSYFGVRHALETLSQVIIFDDVHYVFFLPRKFVIDDGPVFPYRGILLDTSRNFVTKAAILKVIEAMSMSKLNAFHWHITDTHSFPYVSRTWPNMTLYGAYSAQKVYTEKDIKEIIEYGLVRGVRVIPEFDAPAHVGEGWQWVGDNALLCFNKQPWHSYCVEPPCGQLNPTSDRVYEVLEGIYKDMLTDFKPDIFHMGGDEVSIKCWNSTPGIQQWMVKNGLKADDDASYFKLWKHFQDKAYEALTKANNGKEIPVVLWTSGLTDERNIKLLDPKKYIIQIWTTAQDKTISRLIENNFKVIFSNYDAWYFDCGFGSWVGEGNNWCSPFKSWKTVYENSPYDMLGKSDGISTKKHLVLGGEAALWTEQADSAVIDSRLWPRGAALAERLWSNPSTPWSYAEQRMLRHRERLVNQGIMADALQPDWCRQNQGNCHR